VKPKLITCVKCGNKWYYKGEKERARCTNRKCRAWIKIGANVQKRKTRRKMSVEEIFNDRAYRGIIFLTRLGGEKGLRFNHYRRHLIKNHGGLKARTPDFFEERVKDHPLEFLTIPKACFTSITNLSNHLKTLVDRDILERTRGNGKGKFYVYKLSEFGEFRAILFMLSVLIRSLNPTDLKSFYEEVSEKLIADNFLTIGSFSEIISIADAKSNYEKLTQDKMKT